MDECKDGKIQLPDKISELVTCRKTAKRQTKEWFNVKSGYMRGIPDNDLQKDSTDVAGICQLSVCLCGCVFVLENLASKAQRVSVCTLLVPFTTVADSKLGGTLQTLSPL